MKIIELIVAAALLAGCASTTTKQAAAPAPAPSNELTYQVKNMPDFDSVKKKAESACRSQGETAHYVDRTISAAGDTVRFECKAS